MEGFKHITVAALLAHVFVILAVAGPLPAENPLRITTEQDIISIYADNRPLLHYSYSSALSKPYIRQLFTPCGVNVLRDAPADHLHHHGLMFAVNVESINFWEERQGCGRQVHNRFADVRVDKRCDGARAAFTEQLDWMNPAGEDVLLKEHRTIEVSRMTDFEVTLLTWQSKFELPAGKSSATLTGHHYHGLGMRFIKAMDAAGSFFNADGKTGEIFRGNERLVRSSWCAYTANVNGKAVTVAMFDHPDNPRYPATWFTMKKSFAYLSATMSLHTEPLSLAADKPLVLRYGVALWDGRVETEKINRLYKRWSAWPGPEKPRSPATKQGE